MRLIDTDALSKQVRYSMEDDPYSNSPAYGQLSRIYNLVHKHILRIIDDAPTIDAEPVRHGRWNEPYPNDIWDCYECTCCGAKYDRTWNYCPNCGAKMDLEVRDEG